MRLDADAVDDPEALVRALERFAAADRAVLLGTQMVAKGHHFSGVTLAAVVGLMLASISSLPPLFFSFSGPFSFSSPRGDETLTSAIRQIVFRDLGSGPKAKRRRGRKTDEPPTTT